jgi:predicted phage terminase large subunit-like protein
MLERNSSGDYCLSRKQARFLQSEKRTVIYRGGIRSGKTVVLCLKAIEYAKAGKRFCIVSFSYPILRDVCQYTMREILRDIGDPFDERSTDKVFIVNGVEILFRSGDQPDTLRGLSLDGFGIDEAREFKTRDIYDIMIGRLSNNPNAQGFITTSPKGKNWVNDLEVLPNTETIIQRTEENPFLPDEYINSLRSQYTTDFARQELDADIVEFNAGVIHSDWFKSVEYVKPIDGVRYWDLAVSIKTSADRSAGALCSFKDDKFTIHNIICGRFEYPDLRKKIIQTAKDDGLGVVIAFEEAGQQLGFIDDLKRNEELRPYTIRADKPEGDKFNRTMPWASRAQLGNVNVCKARWNPDFFDECNSFTADDTHLHDDQIDAVSGAYKILSHKMALQVF